MEQKWTHADEKELRKIDDLQLSPYTRRYWVVVTPKDIHPKITVPVKHPQDGEQLEISGREDGDRGMVADGCREIILADNPFLVFHYPVRMVELFAPE
jgi:hypothetical protein